MLPKIEYLLIDLIASCNLNCIHCRADFTKHSLLTFNKIKETLKEAKKEGVKTITFSGGEPLLRDDIFKILSTAKKEGFIVRLQSNSLLLDEDKIKKLKEVGLDYFGTGLDGMEKNHDKLRNFSGAFLKTLENIRLLKKYGIKVHVEFTATNFNFNDFEKVMALCSKLGVYDVMTRAVLPSGKGKSIKESLNYNQYKDFLQKIILLRKSNINLKIYCQDPVSLFLDNDRRKALIKKIQDKNIIGGCSAGINMLYISPTGEVQPCSFLKMSFGNLFKKSLKDIIDSNCRKEFLKKQISRNFNLKCSSCEIKLLCGGCRARSLEFNNNLWGEDPMCFK